MPSLYPHGFCGSLEENSISVGMAFSFFKFRDRLRRYASSPAAILRTFRIFLDNRAIRTSALFDVEYYYRENPEVAQLRESPSLHYLACGDAAGKNPSLAFCGAEYLELNPEVRATGMNPLVHYERIGKRKGLRYSFLQPEAPQERGEFCFPSIEEHQASFPSKLESLKKRIRAGERVKAIFFVTSVAMFPARPLFDAMLKDSLFDARIAVVPDLRGLSETNPRLEMEKCKAQVEKEYPREVFFIANQLENGSWNDILAEFNADIVCYPLPYDFSYHRYNARWAVGRQYLPIYVNYGYPCTTFTMPVFAMNVFACAWRVFLEGADALAIYRESSPIHGSNGIVTGAIKMDPLARFPSIEEENKRILVAPHHSVSGGANSLLEISNFLRFSDYFLELPKRYPNVEFVFRPHPFLFAVLSRDAFWGRERCDRWIEHFLSYPNTELSEGGDYLEEFARADAIIQDCASFLVEWMFTGKPGCYMLPEDEDCNLPFLPIGFESLSHYYIARKEAAIDEFIQNVVLGGMDPMADERLRFRKKILVNDFECSKMALNFIRAEVSVDG